MAMIDCTHWREKIKQQNKQRQAKLYYDVRVSVRMVVRVREIVCMKISVTVAVDGW